MDLKELKEWFSTEKGKQSIENFAREMEEEEKESKRLEEISNLKYPNGLKVKRSDLFIDLEAKNRYELDPSSEPYGYYMYVYKINEDNSVDLCINANFAIKLNDVHFDFKNANLVKRNAELHSPLDDLLEL
ncbi:hypothetical protein MZM54_00360 [[Brevibacterium] frigoritolerans]|nr:hypothetical protein [Peribacillus frigoritolerans]